MASNRTSGTVLFVHRGPDKILYLTAHAKQDRLQVSAFGEVDSECPLSEIVERLAAKNVRAKKLVLLLPRSEFDVHVYQVPKLDENEIPLLISNLVAESHDIAEVTTDYVLDPKINSDSQNALTWTIPTAELSGFKSDAKQNGLSLLAVTSVTMGSISLWRNIVKTKSPHAIILNIANRSLDFSVIYNHEIAHVRSIPFASTNDDEIIPRLISELQRTVAITGENDESDSTRIYLFGSASQRKPVAEALTNEFNVAVSILNPLDHMDFKNDTLSTDECESYVHLLGAAKAVFFDKLDVDLVSPRKAIEKRLPWRKIGWYSTAAAVLVGLGGFVFWDDAAKQAEEIVEKRKQFDGLARDARRVLEMKDELAAIRSWRRNEVVWLDELDELSRKLPPREKSLIRRISMLTANDGTSKIDLSVEVSDDQLVAGLEAAIRAERNQVKSKRVSESNSNDQEKWNFETSIQFSAQPPKLSFVNPEEKSVETELGSGKPNSVSEKVDQNGDPISSEAPEAARNKSAKEGLQ